MPANKEWQWDADKAAAFMALGALMFLWAVRRGFRPVLVGR